MAMQKILLVFTVVISACLFGAASMVMENSMVLALVSVALLLVLGLNILFAMQLFKPLRQLAVQPYPAENRELAGLCHCFGAEVRALASVLFTQITQAQQEKTKIQQELEKSQAEQKRLEQEVQSAEKRAFDIQHLLENMGELAGKAEKVTKNIFSALRELAQGASTMGQSVDAQLHKTQESTGIMEQMRQSVHHIVDSAAHAAHGAQDAQLKAETGSSHVQQAVGAIGAVQKSTVVLAETMNTLSKQADNIGQVMGIIQEVADQTTLLALNAAIEAARAGEAGKGFAVVADEVRALAVKTMGATSEVDDAVRQIQLQTQQNLKAVALASTDISLCVERAHAAEKSMTEIIQTMQANADQFVNISAATEQQATNSAEVDTALSVIAEISVNNTQYSKQVSVAVNEISSLLGDLEMIVHALLSGDAQVASSDQLVQWTPALATGVTSVDSQHKSLCKMINDLHTAMRKRESRGVMEKLIAGLKEYTAMHFSSEEKIFENSSYPYVEAHKKLHRNFVAKIAEYEQGVRAGTATVSMDLLNFLKDWLIQHIQGTDLKYVPYVIKAQKG